jgi:hypothetical protein
MVPAHAAGETLGFGQNRDAADNGEAAYFTDALQMQLIGWWFDRPLLLWQNRACGE